MKRGFCPVTDRFFRNIFKNRDGKVLPYVSGIEVEGETAIVHFRGEINANTIPIIKNNCCKKTKLDRNILIDFKEVTHIDSATLAFLVEIIKKLREKNRKMAVLNVSDRQQRLMEITKLDGLIDSYDDEGAALSFLNSA